MNTEPVSIEINLRQNVDTEGQKANKALQELIGTAIRERKEMEGSLSAQSDLVAKLRDELDKLAKQYEKLDKKKDKSREKTTNSKTKP